VYDVLVGIDPSVSETLWTESTYGDTFATTGGFDESGTIYWKVVARGMDGLERTSDEVFSLNVIEGSGIRDEANSNDLPKAFTMYQNYPNPFNPMTVIEVAVPQGEDGQTGDRTTLRVYSVRGRLVRTLFEGSLEPGYHSFVWDGRTDGGTAVPSGIYIAVLERADRRYRIKMLLGR